MAKVTRVELIDDLDGTSLEDKNAETVEFSIDGQSYVIDLSKTNAKMLREDFYKYTQKATKQTTRASSERKPSGSGRSAEELAHVRTWAKENGHEVNERGRIKKDILDAFDKASS